MQRRLFTLEEANGLVPWLQRTFQRATETRDRLVAVNNRLTEIQREQLRRNGTFNRHTELNSAQSELESLQAELNGIVNEIVAEGIIVRDISSGLVDFPSVREGREVYLCWIGGEESIEYWHETNRGFDHRQPL